MQVMITDKDTHKLKELFVTKDEFRNAVDELVKLITEGFGRVDLALEKMKEHDDLLEDHERRLGKVEDKVFA